MSTGCPDTDTLVSVAAALEWDVPGRLEHLAACDHCRSSLAGLAELRRGLADVSAPSGEGGAVPAGGWNGAEAPAPAGAVHARRSHSLVAAATFLVATTTVLLLALLLSAGRSGLLGLAAGIMAGLASILPAPHALRREKA